MTFLFFHHDDLEYRWKNGLFAALAAKERQKSRQQVGYQHEQQGTPPTGTTPERASFVEMALGENGLEITAIR
jgi:hypothetical protein